jgi:hypothetical protein
MGRLWIPSDLSLLVVDFVDQILSTPLPNLALENLRILFYLSITKLGMKAYKGYFRNNLNFSIQHV